MSPEQKPKYSLHGDDGGDDGDEDFNSDNCDDDSEDEEDYEGRPRKRPPPGPKGPRPKIIIPKDRPNFYGVVPGIPIGKIWETRMACCADGIHRPTVAGIHGGILVLFDSSFIIIILHQSLLIQALKELTPSHWPVATKMTSTWATASPTLAKAVAHLKVPKPTRRTCGQPPKVRTRR